MSSYILNVNNISLVTESEISDFTKPFNNQVYIYDCGLLLNHTNLINYGDEVNLSFWKGLQINFGAVNSELTVLSLVAGYTYTYNRNTNTLTIKDSSNVAKPTDTSIGSLVQTTSLGSTGTVSISGVPTCTDTTVYYLKVVTAPTASGDLLGMVVGVSTDGSTYTNQTAFITGTSESITIDGIVATFAVNSTTFTVNEIYTYTITQTYSRSITTIADLGIDFNIYMSHQFEIILGYKDTVTCFLPYAYASTIITEASIFYNLTGISENYLNNDIYSVSYIPSIATMNSYILSELELSFLSFFINITNGTNKVTTNLSSNSKYPFYFTLSDYKNGNIVKNTMISTVQSVDYTIPLLTASLFPALLPCYNLSETLNNRPVYEPWMIYGFLKLLTNSLTSPSSSNEEYEFVVFDLSPTWS